MTPGGDEVGDRLARYEGDGAAMRALLALDAGGMASWLWDVGTNMVTGDDRLAALYGFAPGHWPIPLGAMTALVHPADEPSMTAAIEDSMNRGTDYAIEFRVRRTAASAPDDPAAWRWLGGRGRPLLREDADDPAVMIGVNWDVSGEKAAEERLRLMTLEMDHRVKNAFAVMRALVNIGRRRATDLDSFASDLGAQVQAMADGHALAARLAQKGDDPRPAVPVAEVISIVLGPWMTAEPDRVTMSMNPRLTIASSKTSGLAMLLHELATNAAKHGALRPGGGRLNVTVEETRRGGRLAARLVWNETQGHPAPAKDGAEKTSGFGALLIEHCMSALGASYERAMRPEGIKITVVLPVDRD